MTKSIARTAALALAISLATTAASALPPLGAMSPSARVFDGNDRAFDLTSTRGRPLIVMYEDKDSAKLNSSFKAELGRLARGDHYRQAVALVPVADVRGYDYWPVRGFVKDAIRDESKKEGATIYCDWNGNFLHAFPLQAGTSNVLLYGKDGRLRFGKSGKLTPDEIKEVIRLLRVEVDGP